ncbi:hypothetical protein D3C75_825400 [compost metagenome]
MGTGQHGGVVDAIPHHDADVSRRFTGLEVGQLAVGGDPFHQLIDPEFTGHGVGLRGAVAGEDGGLQPGRLEGLDQGTGIRPHRIGQGEAGERSCLVGQIDGQPLGRLLFVSQR